jgi:glycosyltransferase involved in cell wall biosynthesis
VTDGGGRDQGTISVIVPVWNGERFLAECLAGLQAQERPLDQIVVVDDGSTDGSAAIAEAFAGVTVLRRPHEGLPPTRNAGLAAATGSLIGFCDSDDVWKPDKARLQEHHLEAEPACHAALCRNDVVFAPGVEHPEWLRPDQLTGDLDGISPTGGLFRREILEDIGGFRPEAGFNSDLDMLVRLRTAGYRLDILDERLFSRRVHENNMNVRDGGDLAPMFKVVRDHVHSVRRRRG